MPKPVRRWSPVRRRLLAASALAFAGVRPALAQAAFPSKPLTLINPFPPAGITDLVGRLVAQKMSAVLGQPIVVDSKPGAGAAIGAQYVARSAPDGYTMLIGSNTAFTINPNLNPKLPYHPFKDFVPIATVLLVPNVLLTKPESPYNNLTEVIAFAKKNPGKLTYASYGNGTSPHLVMEHLKHEAGIDIVHIPYKNTAGATQALLAGEVDISFDSLYGASPRMKSGQVKALAVMQPKRSTAAPGVMSTTDAGFPQVGFVAWLALFAPVATPKDVLQVLSSAALKALDDPEVKARYAELGAETFTLAPDAFVRFMQNESDQFAAIIKQSNIRIE